MGISQSLQIYPNGRSSLIGRAPRLHRDCHKFDPCISHIMNIQYLKEPFPHIIIDNHYDDWQQKEIWEELDYLTHPSRMVKVVLEMEHYLLMENYLKTIMLYG